MKWNSRFRCTLACLGFIGLFSIFSFRLIYLQMIMHDYYAEKAWEKHSSKQLIYADRGTIVDVNNEKLAYNLPAEVVAADATHIVDTEATIRLLSNELKIPAAELAEKLHSDRRYIVLKREVPDAIAASLKAKLAAQKLRGIMFEHDSTRIYPNGSMLCHVIGFTDFDHNGIQGVEASMDEYLRGQNGYRFIEHDPSGREIPLFRGQELAPRNGYQVQLTIDLTLQSIVENEIDAAMRQFRPKKATIILMRPQTGEVLAMANRPNFDLNGRADAKDEEKKNRAIIDVMEPGSTFKIVAVAAALNEHKVRPDSTINCENGVFSYGGSKLHDHKRYGDLTVQDILIKSSNIGAAKLALSLGDQKFYEYIRRFGFGDRTGIELPGEINGLIHPPQAWSKISITRMPMGHEVGVTPLQMTVAMATIANGGKLMTPRIVKSVIGEEGRVISSLNPVELRQVISPQTAQEIGKALRGVVSDRGTAAAAAVPGYTIAGKTGTAEKLGPDGHYERDKFVVSFVGYLPADHPEFVGLVVLDDAQTSPELNYGGLVAGPIFARVAEKAARHLDIQPYEEVRKALPAVELRKALSAAERDALTNASRR
jgi:cell division protein FtsI (penicillin-binding protein 3)/stage V sporulation protein D (sporulation-specific penicillin-binding protein)